MKAQGMGVIAKMLLFAIAVIFISAIISTGIAYFYSRNQLEKITFR